MKRYGAPSVKKAFAILSAISSSKEGLGVSELARGLNMAKSTVHGMTLALEEVGAVIRDPQTKRYKLGFTKDARFASWNFLVGTLGEIGKQAIEKSRIDDLF